jgi:hypothetical protein
MTRIALLSLALVVACDDLPHDASEARAPAAPAVAAPPDLGVVLPVSPIVVAQPDEAAPSDEEDAVDPWHEDLPYLVSRFAPHQGLVGTELTLLIGFGAHGCDEAGTCQVTVGGAPAEIIEDAFVLEVIVPDDAETGPVCVTWHDRTECSDEFTVLEGPELYSLSPEQLPANPDDTTLTVRGDGFAPDSQVWLDWQALPTSWGSQKVLEAVAPASQLTPGEHQVFVYSPSAGRCGLSSESSVLVVD